MNRSEKLTKAHEDLVEAIEALTSGEDWKQYLATAAKFHDYSANNVFFILFQRPDATRVAGYTTWKRMGRQVRKGEKGIAILAPCTYRRTDSSDDSDSRQEAGTVGDDSATGEPSARWVLRGFRVVHVFDIAQTEGDPLPAMPARLLTGDEPGQLTERLAQLINAERFSFTLGPLPAGYPGALGLTQFDTRAVTVRDDIPPAHRAKTTAHELAHVLLHRPGTVDIPRERAEVEAESVAYLVCQAAGLESDQYSFTYVAQWSDGDTELVRSTAQRVLVCARQIISALDPDTADTARRDLPAVVCHDVSTDGDA